MAKAKPYYRSRIQFERKRRGWKVNDVAARMVELGFDWTEHTAIEAENRRKLSPEELAGLCSVFEISADELLGRNGGASAANVAAPIPGQVKAAGHRRKNTVRPITAIAS